MKNAKKDNSIFQKIYDITCSIPYGRVTSYGAIARCIGSGISARTVGWALNKCYTMPYFIPAHRVVNRNGLLTGKKHFGGESVMQQLLENEGIKIKNNRVLNFKKLFWEPSKELKNEIFLDEAD